MTIEHKGQYLCGTVGMFPNFEFVRRLKGELEHDNGTIFRYAPHENTVLNQIMAQLEEASITDVPDKPDLIAFIKSITHSNNHEEKGCAVDLLKLVKWYYYHPLMEWFKLFEICPTSRIKFIWISSGKYSRPIYGKNSIIRSLNFDDGWVWIKKDDDGNMKCIYSSPTPF